MAKISDDFEGTVFIPRVGSFGAGDELPADVAVGGHIPVVEPKRAVKRAKDDAED